MHTWQDSNGAALVLDVVTYYSKTLEARSKPLAHDLLASYELARACAVKTRAEFVTEQVTRFEFQVRADTLKTFVSSDGEMLDLRDWDTFLEHQADLWVYLCNWLSLRDVNAKDTNRHRWVVSPLWNIVQDAYGKAEGLARVKVVRQAVNATGLRVFDECGG